jgi:hypothetical protein
MASRSAKSLKRITDAYFGSVGALQAACTDIGSVMEADVEASWDTIQATDATLGDMAVLQENTNFAYTFKLTLEDIVDENVAMALGGEVVGTDIHFNGTGTPTYRCAYLHGFEVQNGGTMKPMKWHILKFAVAAGTSIPLGKVEGGRKLQITCNVLGYPESTTAYKIMGLVGVTADTTPPTVTVVPLDAATAVDKTTPAIAWTFTEAIRSEDVTAAKFFVFDAAGAVIPGTLAINAANLVVTFTPTSALAGSTVHNLVVVGGVGGVRDAAGNFLAATSATQFTTAA